MRGWFLAMRLGRKAGLPFWVALREWRLLLKRCSLPRADLFGLSAGRIRDRFEEMAGRSPLAAVAALPRDELSMEQWEALRQRWFAEAVIEEAERILRGA